MNKDSITKFELDPTNCISMHVRRREGLTVMLSNDRHFEQEDFRILFPWPWFDGTVTKPSSPQPHPSQHYSRISLK